MADDERQSKLKAGREALMAFQQKKKKKKARAKKSNDVRVLDEADTSVHSEPASLIMGSNEGQDLLESGFKGVSPVPFDESKQILLEDDLYLPPDPTARMSTSLPVVPNNLLASLDHPQHEADNQLTLHTHSTDSPDGTIDTHTSTATNYDPRITELEHQLRAVTESKQQIQNELNTALDQRDQAQHEIEQIRNNQEMAISIAKREVTSSYESQVANLQYSLVQSESAHQELERRLSEAKSAHSAEIEKILTKQEEIRATMLAEKDQKHAEHVARLTERFSSQMEASEGPKDVDEQEAERLRMIKSKMREMFEEEKKQIQAAYQQERTTMEQKAQKQIEEYRVQTEQLANAKIQEVHSQFMSAHQALSEQKNQSDTLVQELKTKLGQAQSDYSNILQERTDLQTRYDQLSESHLAELEKARLDSNSLENRLNDWKEKASKLEVRLHKSESESQNDLDSLRIKNEAALNKLKEEHDERLRSLQQLADEYHRKYLQIETEKTVAVDTLRQSHQDELERMRQDHNQEIDTLNQSILESTAERGSLEAAEEHMSSLQKQLENYRKQELSFQNQLCEKEREYKDGMETFRQQYQREKTFEIDEVTARFNSKIKSLEEELASLTAAVESGDTERKHKEKEESLKARHKKRVSELEAIHEQAIKNLRQQLESNHSEQLEALTLDHTLELSTLREECAEKVEAEKRQITDELDELKQAEIQQLVEEHQSTLEKITQSVADGISTKSQERLVQLEKELSASKEECSQLEAMRGDLLSQLELAQRETHEAKETLQRTSTEMDRLSQDCDRYQNKSKTLEVDLSISQSAHEQDKQRVSALQKEVDELQTKLEALKVEVKESKQSQSAQLENEELLTKLTSDLASKNVTIAELQAQNDSLNTEVFSLTQKCQQLVAKSNSLQEQLETSWGANEEIESLKQQIVELAPIKDEAAGLKEKIEIFESTLKSKDEVIVSLQAQVEQATQCVTDSNALSLAKDQTIAESAGELEMLRQTLATKETKEKELLRMAEDFEHQLKMLNTSIREKDELNTELVTSVQNLQKQLSSSSDDTRGFKQQVVGLEQELVQTKEALTAALREDHREPYERLREDFEKACQERDELTVKLSEISDNQKQTTKENLSWQEKVAQLEYRVEELQTKLDHKEAELSKSKAEFNHKLKEAELREKSLRNSHELMTSKEKLGKETGSLEDTLSRARQALTEKLLEKTTLEKELSLHRAELERRLTEKQRLEELLVEKSRFEQELQSQKEQLHSELEVIESKLKLKETERTEDHHAKGRAKGKQPKCHNKQIGKTRHKK